MIDLIRNRWAAAYCNSDFIYVQTYSGFRSGTHADPKGKEYFLRTDASDDELGCSILAALAASRFVLPAPRAGSIYSPEVEFDAELYDSKSSEEMQVGWIKKITEAYGYKTKRALFKDMRYCSVTHHEGTITIRPWHHEKLDSWSGEGFTFEDYLNIRSDSGPAVVGAALRSAFGKCTG
jgi:hypothetical protein